jgi:hypothetical protein
MSDAERGESVSDEEWAEVRPTLEWILEHQEELAAQFLAMSDAWPEPEEHGSVEE